MTVRKPWAGFLSKSLRAAGDAIARAQRNRARLCIVNYHRILDGDDPLLDCEPDVRTFRWQMELLAECFHVMPLADAVQALRDGDMPPRTVCITFDDGYRSTYDLALPVLREFGLPATVFVASGFLGKGNMWNDRIIEAVRRLPEGELDLRDINLGLHVLHGVEDRKRAIHRLTADSKYLPSRVRLELASRLESLAGEAAAGSLMLTPDMVRALAGENMEIGGHTISHPILTSLEDEQARREIEGGKRELEAILGAPLRLFAYPNGKAGIDFDERHVAMAREAGFAAAFTTAAGAATARQDCFQLPRCQPWDDTPFKYGLRLLRWLAY